MVDIGQKTLGARRGYCRGRTAALANEPQYGAQQSALCLQPSDETTSEISSHLTRPSMNAYQVAGYGQAINACQVAGYPFCQAQ